MNELINKIGRRVLETVYYTAMKKYSDEGSDPYCGGNIKFPVAKNCHIPHIMFPTEIGKNGSRTGNHYLFLFFKTLIQTIEAYPSFFNDLTPVDIVWSEKQKKWSTQEKCLVVEHGWLPRSSYQIGEGGANGRSAPENRDDYIDIYGGKQFLIERLKKLRSTFYILQQQNYIVGSNEYIVVPLQTGTDLNLRDSLTDFSKYYGKDNATELFVKDFISYVNNIDLPFRIFFTQHPTDKKKYDLDLRQNDFFYTSDSGISTLELIRGEKCKGVLSVNSNVIHEALCLNIPCCVLGRLFWREADRTPFINDPSNFFLTEKIVRPFDDVSILSYLAKLLCYQWYLADLQNPAIVREILLNNKNMVPASIRKHLSVY